MSPAPPESLLRRWWRECHTAAEGMETSGYAQLADRIEALEERMRRLEAVSAPATDDPAHP